MKNRFRRKLLYGLTVLLRAIFRNLPPSWGIGFGSFMGRFAFWAVPKERRKTLDHLRVAFSGEKSPKDILKIGENVFRNLGKTAAELIYFPKITEQTVDRWVSCEGLPKFDAVLKEGKGGIILVAHLGNWELLARSLALKGYGGVILARRVYDERFDRLLSEIRKVRGNSFLDRDESPKEFLKVLRQNHFMGILADQDIDSIDGIFVPFFGKEAYTPVAPARFSMASGAPVIPCFMVREENGRHRLVVEDPIWPPEGRASPGVKIPGGPPKGVDKEEAVFRLTQGWMAITESYIRRYPDQWVWMHRRWKTRPENTNDK
ncbi:MAG: lysophospholipid acyltransferase family protein [Candidatus Omnitrophota bacterium]